MEPLDAGQSGPPNQTERRVFPRRRMRGTATFVPADKPFAPGTRITLVDISQSGNGFFVAKELTPGQTIRIRLETSSGPGLPTGGLAAEVRWIAPAVTPGQFRVGCAWTARLSYADLLRFS